MYYVPCRLVEFSVKENGLVWDCIAAGRESRKSLDFSCRWGGSTPRKGGKFHVFLPVLRIPIETVGSVSKSRYRYYLKEPISFAQLNFWSNLCHYLCLLPVPVPVCFCLNIADFATLDGESKKIHFSRTTVSLNKSFVWAGIYGNKVMFCVKARINQSQSDYF